MKRVDAYEATDGTLHKSREEAARASLAHLLANSPHSSHINTPAALAAAAMLVRNRQIVLRILRDIDTKEDEAMLTKIPLSYRDDIPG